jgi:hypothetical protein
MTVISRSEDILIFYGLTPGVTKLAPVSKSLSVYFEKKKAIDPSERFNIILFLENAPNYLEGFTLNPEHIIKTLKTYKKKMVKANIGGGIFVAVTFIIDVFKTIGEKLFRLIILTDEGSRKVVEAHVPILEQLIEQVRDMPFYIDVIQMTKTEKAEDIELTKLANRCGGNTRLIPNVKFLDDALDSLVTKKDDLELKQKDKIIPGEYQPFYQNLAAEPILLDREETCSVCFKKDDKDIVMCPSCETIVHKSCWSQWAKTSNIGMINVFRCHTCYNLLTIDKDYVRRVQYGEVPAATAAEEIKVEVLNLQDYLESLEFEDGPKIIKVESQLLPVTSDYEGFY